MQRRSPAFIASTSSFPNPALYGDEELIAISEAFTPDMVKRAYPKGIFPWFEQEGFIFWFCTHPRMLMQPSEVYVSKSMRKVLRDETFQIRQNTAFEQVMRACSEIPRGRENESWISERFIEVFLALHQEGVAHSAEAWVGNELVGGLYGLKIGQVFYGESMFARQSNASKAAYIEYCRALEVEGIKLIDCQVPSEHLNSLGGRILPKNHFLQLLASLQ